MHCTPYIACYHDQLVRLVTRDISACHKLSDNQTGIVLHVHTAVPEAVQSRRCSNQHDVCRSIVP